MTALRCAVCKRRLKRPTPAGIGPVCARKLSGASQERRTAAPGPRMPPKPPRGPTRPHGAPHCDGQEPLPLTDPPTLWSP